MHASKIFVQQLYNLKALVHTKAHGKVLLRKVVSQLAKSQQHSSSSGVSLLSSAVMSIMEFDVSSSTVC